MRSFRILSIFIVIICLNLSAIAQKTWSLEECINYAIENNITVKRQELNAEAANKTHFQSLMELLPNLNANGNHFLNSGKTLNTETYTYENQSFQGGSVNLSSEITLFNGLQNFNNAKKDEIRFSITTANS